MHEVKLEMCQEKSALYFMRYAISLTRFHSFLNIPHSQARSGY